MRLKQKDKILKLGIILIAILGSLVSIIGFLVNFAMGFGCKWVWLLSAIGWGMFTATLNDLINLEKLFSVRN